MTYLGLLRNEPVLFQFCDHVGHLIKFRLGKKRQRGRAVWGERAIVMPTVVSRPRIPAKLEHARKASIAKRSEVPLLQRPRRTRELLLKKN